MRFIVLSLIVAFLVPVPGCDLSRPSSGPGIGEAAPVFSHYDLDGVDYSLEALRGQVVVLDFWATWCGPCTKVSPYMQQLHEKYGEAGVTVISVHMSDPNGDPRAYMEEHEYTYPVLPNADNVAEPYVVTALPTLVIIDQAGEIAYRQEGFEDMEGFVSLVEKILREPGDS